jgi:hypothetical protein
VFARVARFEGMNAEAAAGTMEEADKIIRPLVEALHGYRGHLELVADGGGFLSLTFFDSEEDVVAAEPTFDEEMPRQLGEIFGAWGGRRVDVTRYRVAQDERV